MLPDGPWGPVPACRNDGYLLRENNINGRLAELQADAVIQFKLYGDAAYRTDTHRTGGRKGAALSDAQKRENENMSKARERVWSEVLVVRLLRLQEESQSIPPASGQYILYSQTSYMFARKSLSSHFTDASVACACAVVVHADIAAQHAVLRFQLLPSLFARAAMTFPTLSIIMSECAL
jgi:hypothetical protein